MFSELFYKDPYIKEFEAAVVSCEKSKKGLCRTITGLF